MDYHVMLFEECPRCKQFESDYKFKQCSFSVSTLKDGTVLQEFQCTKCEFKWERKYESRSNN